ncbi:MAG: HAD-IIIA family hydrolase [Parcubacteria group bacterium]|nr:HAD-IIIA family hydrolase [Parcubacteria group bacterium]
MKEVISSYIGDLKDLFLNTKVTDLDGADVDFTNAMEQAANDIITANSKGKKVIFSGNGGSASVANHKALDFWFTGKIRGLSFSDSSLLTCVSNDFGYSEVFAKPINMFADTGDIFVGISSSGNSENIVRAAEEARARGCKVFTFSGFGEDNRLRQNGDLNFYIESKHYNKVESTHLLLCDCILELIVKHKEKFISVNEHDIIKDAPSKKVLIALDRDGTINYDSGFFGKNDNWREELKLYSGAAYGIKKMNEFAKTVVITNQFGVAREYLTEERVKEVNQAISSLLETSGAKIENWYYCPFVEKTWAEREGINLNNRWVSDNDPELRKPNIGMLKRAAEDMGAKLEDFSHIYVVGDRISDVETGINAGGKGVLVGNEKNQGEFEKIKDIEEKHPGKILLADNLLTAAELIRADATKL